MSDGTEGSDKPMPRGVATGIGSMPGINVRAALGVVTDLVPELIYLPELPARGPGGEMIGRTFGLLNSIDAALGIETQPSGWRFARGEGLVMRRAKSWLAEDCDALEEIASSHDGWIKLQFAGPITLASSVEFAYGERMISDLAAVRDFAQALTAGIELTLSQLRRRLPQAQWVVQIDEPWLGSALRAGVPSRSGLHALKAIDAQVATDLLGGVATAIGRAGAISWIHTCEQTPPLRLLEKSVFDLISVDAAGLDERAVESVESFWERGQLIGIGFAAPQSGVSEKSEVDSRLGVMQRLARHLSVDLGEMLEHIVVTPSCGLAYSENVAAELRLAGRVIEAMRSA